MVTRRFIWLIAAGVPFVFAGYFIGLAVPFFVLYNVLCFIVLSLDVYLTPSSDIFEVERIGDDKLSIYERETISIRVYNKSDNKLRVQLKDSIPDFYFENTGGIVKRDILPHGREVLEYQVTPRKRGAFTFGDIYIRYTSKLGFCLKAFKVSEKREYKVYPNLKSLRKYHMSVCNNRKYKIGFKNMKMMGTGTSFESLREYMTGDEYRKINWKATAREDRPIINHYEPEKDQHVYSLIDCGRPMSYSIRGFNKLDMAVDTALVLSDIVNQNGDKSGLLTFNTELQSFVSPGKGSGHRNRIMETLYHIEHTNYTSNYEEAFIYLKKNERHRSILFLFTDFDSIEEAEEMLKLLTLLSKNNIVVIILIKNESLEEIAKSKAKTEDEVFSKGVAIELLLDRRNIINRLNKLGVMCMECEIENVELNTINKYLQIKNRMYF